MKKRNLILLTSALLAVLLVVGGTMAWFTAQADPVANKFEAGTVEIILHDKTILDEEGMPMVIEEEFDILGRGGKRPPRGPKDPKDPKPDPDPEPEPGDLVDFPEDGFKNVNPGDRYPKIVYVENIGSKRAYVRVKLTPEFDPSDLDPGVVNYPILAGWVLHNGWYYYTDIVHPGDSTDYIIELVEFAGAAMGNEYQGAKFTLTVEAEAIQVTNGAALDLWGVDPSSL